MSDCAARACEGFQVASQEAQGIRREWQGVTSTSPTGRPNPGHAA